jgi:hypothetical protein
VLDSAFRRPARRRRKPAVAPAARLVLAALAAALLLGAGGAAAQSEEEIVHSLLSRIDAADERLRLTVEDKALDKRPVSKDEVRTLFTRGFEYYRTRDYFTAKDLFNAGLLAWMKMGWPEDDTYGRARFYHEVAWKRFCLDEEAEKCKVYLRASPRTYLSRAEEIYRDLSSEQDFPADLRDEAKRECRAAYDRLRALCRADKTGDSACNKLPASSC